MALLVLELNKVDIKAKNTIPLLDSNIDSDMLKANVINRKLNNFISFVLLAFLKR